MFLFIPLLLRALPPMHCTAGCASRKNFDPQLLNLKQLSLKPHFILFIFNMISILNIQKNPDCYSKLQLCLLAPQSCGSSSSSAQYHRKHLREVASNFAVSEETGDLGKYRVLTKNLPYLL